MRIGKTFDLFSNNYARFGEEKYIKLKEHGYDCLDFNLMGTETVFYGDNFEKEVKKARREIESAGLSVFQTHGPWRWPPQDGRKEERAERLEKFKKAVLCTALFGAKYMVAHPIMPFGMEDRLQGILDEAFFLNVDFWGELALFGERQGVTVCVENMPMPNFSVATPEVLLRLVDEIGGESIGVCLDTGHVNVFPELKIGEEIRRLGGKLKTLHVHDNDGVRDIHLHPFDGTVDWKAFTQSLKEIGFDGVMNLETQPNPDLAGETYIDECLRLANKARVLASLSMGDAL